MQEFFFFFIEKAPKNYNASFLNLLEQFFFQSKEDEGFLLHCNKLI